jgi:membrane-associated phospholipid phosphatase
VKSSPSNRLGRHRLKLPRAAGIVVAFVVAIPAGSSPALADTASKIGDVAAIALPLSGLAVAAGHRDGKGALQLVEAYGATMAVVYILKPTIDRQRPNGGGQSFPSGHSASAFAGAAFLQRRYGWGYGVPAYAVATFVAWSRVDAKQHWTSDVIAGGAIGIAANLVFTRRYSRVSIAPAAVPGGGVGLTFELRW